MTRLAGFCLIALAVACWPSGDSTRGFQGMLVWSVLAMGYLVTLGLRHESGMLLWPATVAHALIIALLLRARSRQKIGHL